MTTTHVPPVIKPRTHPAMRPAKHGSMLWLAVRKSIPAFVPRVRQRFRRRPVPRFMLDPEAKPKLLWDGFITCCVFYTTCIVPYRVCFKREADGGFAVFETSLDVFFFIDIVLNFLTGVHVATAGGEVSYDFAVIARAYFKGWFLIDVFSTLPFEDIARWFNSGEDGDPLGGARPQVALASAKLLRSLKILRLFKLARIRKLTKMFSSLEEAVFTNQSLLSLIKLALSMLILSHLVACLWFALGNGQPPDGSTTWVRTFGFTTADESTTHDAALQYLVSVYWAIVTMVTIGYGDVLAKNTSERLFTIAIMAIGVSFFGYVIGTISSLVANLNVSAALYDERLTRVKEYIISRAIPTHLSKRIRDHFEYYYQNRTVFKEKKILARLPSTMRNEMIHHVHAKIVASVHYFSSCHESLISDIVMSMIPFSVLKDEYVYVQHEIAAHVFFLLKGKIHLTKTAASAAASTTNTKSPVSTLPSRSGGELRLATLSVGEHFGELEVYDHEHGNGVRICSAMAKSYCELTFLSRQAISKISASWPEVLRHFKDTAKASSKRMRRRVDKRRSVNDDDDHHHHHSRCTRIPGGGGEGDDNEGGSDDDDDEEGNLELFRDEEMERTMMRSTLLMHKTMRATVRQPLPGRGPNKISPFMDNTHQHAAKEDDEDDDKQAENEAVVHALPATDDVHTVDKKVATKGARLVLDALVTERLRPVEDEPQPFLDVGTAVETPSSSPSPAAARAAPLSPVPRKGAVYMPKHDDQDSEKNEVQTLSRPRSAEDSQPSTIKVDQLMDKEGANTDAEDAVQSHPTSQVESPPLDAVPKPSAAAVLTRMQSKPTAFGLPLASIGGVQDPASAVSPPHKRKWKAAATSAVVQVKKEYESRRSLNDIIAKLRTSPTSRPKPNFHSEQVMLKGTYLFHPQEPFILTWQFVVGLGILYSIIVVPYRLGFDAEATGGWGILEMIIDVFFGLDMIINFRTAFFDEERLLIFDARVICWRYLKGWFLLDFMSTVPIDEIATAFIGSDNGIKFFPTKLLRLFRIARLLKLARLIKLSRVAGRLRGLIQLSPSTERLTKLLLMMSLFCHWNACAFHAVMLAGENSESPNWCKDFFPPSTQEQAAVLCTERVTRQDRYIAAIYWAFTTFTTVGYGDIKPSMYSTHELLLVILLVVINSTVYGYIISAVVRLIENLDPSDREYRLRMYEMKDYLRDASVSARVGASIKAHYQHILASSSLFPEEKLFDKMSPSLRFDIARLVAGETLFAIPLITVMEDSFKGFVSYALFLMKPICILRSEMVCRSGGPGTEMFFLVDGECDLVNSDTGEGCVIGQNAVFEQYSLMARPDEIYRTVSTVTAISKKAILYSLAIQDFKVLEDVSPAVSTYFLSQLAAVLVEDDLFALTPRQKENVECALRNGRAFRAVAEQHEKSRLTSVGNVAIAKLKAPKRRGSEWAPDLLPRLLNRMENNGNAPVAAHQSDEPSHPNGVPE